MQIIKYYLLLLRQETKTGSEITEMTDYCGNIVYKDSSLAFILMPEGRIMIDTLNSSLLTFNYFLSDHLGNTRSVISQSGEVLEENAYYPFGMQINALSYSNTAPENMYLYNNKELTSDFGLDWYEYGARMYDAEIARFPSLDPKADEFAFVSPYNYAENEPVAHIDLWGLQQAQPPYAIGGLNYILKPNEANQKERQRNQNTKKIMKETDVKLSVGPQFGGTICEDGLFVNFASWEIISKNKTDNKIQEISQEVDFLIFSLEHNLKVNKNSQLQIKDSEETNLALNLPNFTIYKNLQKKGTIKAEGNISFKIAFIIGIEIKTKIPLKNK